MKPYKVLIVEDHPFQHEYLLKLFRNDGGFEVDSAWSGSSALNLLQRYEYDLMVSDLFMPEMDGVQLFQKITSLKKRPAIALMSVASRRLLVSAGLSAKNLGLKVVGLISKPVVPNAVIQLRSRLDALASQAQEYATISLSLERNTLVQAMGNGQIQAWFQPKKSLRNGKICSAEALVRWCHPTLGVLPPSDFLGAIAQFNLEDALVGLMLEQSLKAQAFWRSEGFDVPVSVNIPTHLLDSNDLADRLYQKVMEAGAEPQSICFELMESSTTEKISNFYAGACRLRMMGFGLAQDDFGKGYSSYFNLVSTPFSELKIDRSLVHGCLERESLALALESIVDLSHKLGLIVTAEGVETQEELEFLRRIECDLAQGFIICAAIRADDFIELLLEDSPKPALT